MKKISELFIDFSKPQKTFSDTLVENRKRIFDSYSNELLGIGKADKKKEFNFWDLSNNSNNWSLWLAMYNDSWIFRRAIDKPAQDIINLGVKYITEKNEDLSSIKSDILSIKQDLIHLLMWGALFGGSIGILLFDNISLDELEKPLNESKVKTSHSFRLWVLDRWNGINQLKDKLVLDVTSPDFLKPEFYEVRIGNKMIKVHHSYVLRYEHRQAPNFVRNGELQGWGYPEGVHLVNELMRDEKIKNSITSLIDKSLIEVIKMSGMRGVFMGADADNERQLRKRLEMVNWGRNFNSLTFLDKDDDYQQNEFGGLSGLSDLMDKNMETIAAALDMTGVLYGDMSGGFSPDNYALVRYDTTIRNKADAFYRPILQKLIDIFKIKHNISSEIKFEFETMIQVQEDKYENASKIVGLVSSMLGDGYITVEQAGREIMKFSKEWGIGDTITEESLRKLNEDNENPL